MQQYIIPIIDSMNDPIELFMLLFTDSTKSIIKGIYKKVLKRYEYIERVYKINLCQYFTFYINDIFPTN